jgi:hypothetical protein
MMKELNDYIEAKTALDAKFNGCIGDHDVEDMTAFRFFVSNYDVTWFDAEGEEYSEEIRVKSTDDSGAYTALLTQSCFGDHYIGVFDNSKQIK